MEQPKPIYFISDLHLGTTYDSSSRRREQLVVEFLDSIADKAGALYMVGDILDYWYEYRTVVPRGYVRFFGALARLADRGVKITWFIGNHDIWLFDYVRDEIGVEIVDGMLVTNLLGRRFLISHGDGVGQLPFGFRCIRSIFRNRVCQKLYASIHPRWTIPFAHRWSSHSRCNEKPLPPFDIATDSLAVFAQEWQTAHSDAPVDFFVFGHKHIMVNETLPDGAKLVILGDWLRYFSYGVFDGKNFLLERFCSKLP
ncbi:MAG: UDP-2,3-diacylglucosamine diphosphatase [Barnesiella sp.]|nr:UDP-2,3-diacylglucosamine diphosphatase [Barnesiella sp.]